MNIIHKFKPLRFLRDYVLALSNLSDEHISDVKFRVVSTTGLNDKELPKDEVFQVAVFVIHGVSGSLVSLLISQASGEQRFT